MPKRILQGVVVSDACDKTVIVRVERRVMHPVYKKFITRSKKYAAHDEHNVIKAGDDRPHRGKPADLQAQALDRADATRRRQRRPRPRRSSPP